MLETKTIEQEALDNPFEGWVTINEASDAVNRNHATVRYWIETGKIAGHPIGSSGLRVVNLEEVKAYSEQALRLNLPKRGKQKKATV